MRKFAIIAALSVALTGCVSAGTKVDTAQLQQFKKGVTTEAEVIARLGEPNTRTMSSGGLHVIGYSHVAARPDAVDFVPIVGSLAGGAKSETTVVIFTFDETGVLKDYTATTSNTHLKTGIAN